MTAPLVYIVAPLVGPDSGDEAFADTLRAAVSAAPVAVVRLTLPLADERTLVNRLKAFCPIVQNAGAAAILDVVAPSAGLGALDLAAVVTRGGADGVHCRDFVQALALQERLRGERVVGLGNPRSRHDCMEAGEAEIDYLMFGEPRADGSIPTLDATLERAQWWAEIFETPCAVYAQDLDDVRDIVATGAEFIAGGEVVFGHPEGPASGVKALAGSIAAAYAALGSSVESGGGSR